MKRILPLALLLAIPTYAAFSVSFVGATQTQAVYVITDPFGDCTVDLSTDPSYSPPHPDVDTTKHAGSNLDTSRTDTIVRGDGSRILTLGHMEGDRALGMELT